MKQILIGLGAITLTVAAITIILIVTGHSVAGAILGTATVFFGEALLIAFIIALTAWWTRETMRAGAEIGLRAQESDDKRDIALISGLTNLARELLKRTQTPALPAPPLPSQQASAFLPPLNELADVVEGEVNHDWPLGGNSQ